MAKIPQIISREDLPSTGGSGPQGASLDSFGPTGEGLGVLSRGLSMLGQGTTAVAENIKRTKEIQRVQGEVRFMSERATDFDTTSDKWLTEHQNDEDLAETYDLVSSQWISSALENSPSEAARGTLSAKLKESKSQALRWARMAGAKNKQEGLVTSFKTQQSDMLESYYEQLNRGMGPQASVELTNRLAKWEENVVRAFPQAPALVEDLKNKAAYNTAYALMLNNPAYAESFIKESSSLEESQRWSLLNALKAHYKEIDVSKQTQFKSYLEDLAAKAEVGENVRLPDLSEYIEAGFEEKYARDMQARINDTVQSWQTFHNYRKDWEGYSPEALSAAMATLDQEISTGTNLEQLPARVLIDARGKLQQWASHYLKQMDDDVVNWMQNYNPFVKVSASRPQTPEEVANTANMLMHFQGTYRPEYPEWQKKYFLGRASGDRHLLSKPAASAMAEVASKGPPSEFLSRIAPLLENYTEDQKNIIVDDLSSIPDSGSRLPQGHKLVWENRDSPSVSTLLSTALQNSAKYLDRLTDVNKKDLNTQVMSPSGAWMQYATALVGNDPTQVSLLSGYEHAIKSYAAMLMQPESGAAMNAESAVAKAVKDTVDRVFGIAEVDGRKILIPRKATQVVPFPDNKEVAYSRSDEEIADIGRQLDWSKLYLDPREIDTTNWKVETVTKDMFDPYRMDEVWRRIQTDGYFIWDHSGKYLELVMDGDFGRKVVTDWFGNHLSIRIDQLPSFVDVIEPWQGGGPTTFSVSTPRQQMTVRRPPPLKSLVEEKTIMTSAPPSRTGAFGGAMGGQAVPMKVKVTNWPMTANYWTRRGPEAK